MMTGTSSIYMVQTRSHDRPINSSQVKQGPEQEMGAQQTLNICITFVQCWTNVKTWADVLQVLFKCFANYSLVDSQLGHCRRRLRVDKLGGICDAMGSVPHCSPRCIIRVKTGR